MKYKVWKTVTIDKKPDTTDINISNGAQSMLGKIKWNKKETIDLVRVKVGDLGFTTYATTTQIYAKAKKEGLQLCLPQVGLQLRVDYKEQPSNEWLYIGMEPIPDSDGYPRVFRLARHDGGLWLRDRWTRPDGAWFPGGEFVFTPRKSKTKTLKPLTFDTLKLRHFELSENDWEHLETYLKQTKIGKLFLTKIKITK